MKYSASKLLLFAFLVAIGTPCAIADDSRVCNCAVYLRTSLNEAVVIDHDHGWVDEKFGPELSSLQPNKPGSPGFRNGQMVDCSDGKVRCADLRALKLVLAFRDGEVGSVYFAKNFQFTIFSKLRISSDPMHFLYNIQFKYPNSEARGRMIYTTTNGVVGIFVENSSAGDFLVSGNGVLAPQGFPSSSRE